MPERTRKRPVQAGLLMLSILLGLAVISMMLCIEVNESLARYEVRTDANREQIDRLWDAHHVAGTPGPHSKCRRKFHWPRPARTMPQLVSIFSTEAVSGPISPPHLWHHHP